MPDGQANQAEARVNLSASAAKRVAELKLQENMPNSFLCTTKDYRDFVLDLEEVFDVDISASQLARLAALSESERPSRT